MSALVDSLRDERGRPTPSGVAWVRENLARVCVNPVALGGGRFAKCKSRSFGDCPHCAASYRRDWSHILFDGVRGVAGRFFFVTVTAPSFGAVHLVPKKRADVGRAGWRCPCGGWHRPEQGFLRGVAVDVDGYDYLGQVAWNAAFGRLWNVTRAALRRNLPEFDAVMVREWQARGVLHGHALLRFGRDVEPALVERVVREVVLSVRSGSGVDAVRWGERVDVQEVAAPGGADGMRDVVGYVGKVVGYVAKDLVGAGLASGRGGVRGLFFGRLAEAARVLACGPECRGVGCRNRRHVNYGAASCVVSCTRASEVAGRRGWSVHGLTRSGEIGRRRAFAVERAAGGLYSSERCREEMGALAGERRVADVELSCARAELTDVRGFGEPVVVELGSVESWRGREHPVRVEYRRAVAEAEARVAEAAAHARRVHEDTACRLAVWRARHDEAHWVTPPEQRARLYEMVAYHRAAYRLGIVGASSRSD